jgi:hypothetical protein
MEQGHFRIAPGINRTLMATNGFGNAGLFRGLASQLKARGLRLEPAIETMIKAPGAGPVSLEHLKSLIRTIASTSSTK